MASHLLRLRTVLAYSLPCWGQASFRISERIINRPGLVTLRRVRLQLASGLPWRSVQVGRGSITSSSTPLGPISLFRNGIHSSGVHASSASVDISEMKEMGVDDFNAVLDLWFGSWATSNYGGESSPKEWLVKARTWFSKDDAFDALLREKFLCLVEAAGRGQLAAWEETPRGTLALVVLLDQFSRNIYRGTPASFAQDALALAISQRAIAKGFERRLGNSIERCFLLMPFQHSEDVDMVSYAFEFVQREAQQAPPGLAEYMRLSVATHRRHLEIVRMFGRYPHRNKILGRASTPEEIEFLKQPNSSF
eukprot:jgi/Mesen1/4707/ME000241S03749